MSEAFREALRHGEDCPELDVMLQAMEPGGSGNDRISAHLEKCPSCQTELALFRTFEAGDVDASERKAVDYIVRRLRSPQSVPWWRRLMAFGPPLRLGGFAVAAAALLLTIGLSTQWQSRRGAPELTPQAGQQSDTMRSSAVRGILPHGEVTAFPRVIRWEPVPGASAYTVSITEVDRNVIFNRNVTTPQLDLPQDVLNLMVPGKAVLLAITASDSLGSLIAQSGTLRVIVHPDPVFH
jgi:hypothetical protein